MENENITQNNVGKHLKFDEIAFYVSQISMISVFKKYMEIFT